VGTIRFTLSGSNRVKWQTLATPLANVGDGAFTAAWVHKRASTSFGYQALGYGLSGAGAGTAEHGMSITNSNAPTPNMPTMDASGAAIPTTLTEASTTEYYATVLRKAAGSSAVNYSRYVRSTTTWTHEAVAAVADQIAFTQLELGAWQGGDFGDEWLAANAWWEGNMSQANVQALVTNWRTSDLWQSAHGQPVFLVEGNVTGASLVDLAGNASNITVTGTSLDAAETMDSWNYDGLGGPPLVPGVNPTFLDYPRKPLRGRRITR
jgi:hypothetical protein